MCVAILIWFKVQVEVAIFKIEWELAITISCEGYVSPFLWSCRWPFPFLRMCLWPSSFLRKRAGGHPFLVQGWGCHCIMVLLDCIILHYIILRPCLYTFNVGSLPHLFRRWIAQVVDTSTLERGWLPAPYKRLGWPVPILFWRWPLSLCGKWGYPHLFLKI